MIFPSALVVCLAAALPLDAKDTVRDSVVNVHVTHRYPNLLKPWAKQAPRKSSGSGHVIAGGSILTNAHVVMYASQIYVQAYQADDKVSAKVAAISPEADLAVLELDDKSFFDKRPPLPMADGLPRIKGTVNVYGYPIGGNDLSITEGIVSRIEFADYFYGTSGLRIQVDAALNPGNSGGPAIADGKVVGLVFSGIRQAENIGYLIPVEEIDTFLKDIADGGYDGKVQIFDGFQTVENKALRDRIGLDVGAGGVLVQTPYRDDDDYPLKEWDVVTQIGHHRLDREGKVQIAEELRLSFRYLVPKLAKDQQIRLTVFRDGESIQVQVPVKVRRDAVIPFLHNKYPRYFIYGPLVFSQATQELINRIGHVPTKMLSARHSPLVTRHGDEVAFDREEIVIVSSRMFSHGITKGYSEALLRVIDRINGVKIRNLAHLVETLRDADDKFIEFKFAGTHQENMVYLRDEIVAATEQILEDNGIRHQYSKDLKTAWLAKMDN